MQFFCLICFFLGASFGSQLVISILFIFFFSMNMCVSVVVDTYVTVSTYIRFRFLRFSKCTLFSSKDHNFHKIYYIFFFLLLYQLNFGNGVVSKNRPKKKNKEIAQKDRKTVRERTQREKKISYAREDSAEGRSKEKLQQIAIINKLDKIK